MTTEQLLREALRVAHDHLDMHSLEVSHCKDAALIRAALSAHAQPASGEADTGPQVLRQVFELCEATEEADLHGSSRDSQAAQDFMRGRKFEAKQIRKAIGIWFQDEFCGRSFMGEPVSTPPASQEQAQHSRKPMPEGDLQELTMLHAPPIHPDFKDDDGFEELCRAVEQYHFIK